MEAEVAEEVAGVVPVEAVDWVGIPVVAAVEGVDSVRTAVAGTVVAGTAVEDMAVVGKAVEGIVDTPGENNLVGGRTWAGPAPSSSWHAPHLLPST